MQLTRFDQLEGADTLVSLGILGYGMCLPVFDSQLSSILFAQTGGGQYKMGSSARISKLNDLHAYFFEHSDAGKHKKAIEAVHLLYT